MISPAWTKDLKYQVAWRDTAYAWGLQHVVIVGSVLLWQVVVVPYHSGINLLHPFITYDADVYIRIARSGYTIITDTPYFPLYPLLIRAFAFGGQYAFAALVVANAFGFLAFLLLRNLIEEERDQAIARRALLYLACFPTSLFLLAGYTESMFLVLSLLTFTALRKRSWNVVAVCAALATVTRSAGILLLIPIALEGWRALRWRIAPVMLPSLAALAIWNGYLISRFHGGITKSMDNSAVQRHFDWPWFGMVRDIQSLGHTILILEFGAVRDLIFTFAWIVLVVAICRKLPGVYSAFAVACLLLVLITPQHLDLGRELTSAPRYMLTCFPIYWMLAQWGKRKWAHLGILFAEWLLLAIFSIAFATGVFIA
jgi:Gpi18-like mannosyltransferase